MWSRSVMVDRHPGIRQYGSRARTRRATAAVGRYVPGLVATTCVPAVVVRVSQARHWRSAANARATSAGTGPQPGTTPG